MNVLWKNVKLFFSKPKELFSTLRERPNLKIAAILLIVEVFSMNLPNIKGFLSKYPDAVLMTVALIMSTILEIAIISVSLILGSFYVVVFCRIFGSKPKFSSILSSLIYCGIPVIIFSILYTLFAVKIDLSAIVATKNLHPFLITIIQGVDLAWLWITVMEIIAIAVIAGIHYFRSFIIILSYWIFRSIIIYFLGLRIGEIYKWF